MQNINFHTKLPSQKTILKQIEWKGQNGPIGRSGAATNYPNVHFCTFHKNLSCGCIFPASILNKVVFQQKNKFLLKSYFPSAIQIYKKYLWRNSDFVKLACNCNWNEFLYRYFSIIFSTYVSAKQFLFTP